MEILGFITLVITGFTSCAEFGSYAFVHPVIRQLPPEHHIRVEQGLLKTFGRVMPVLMTLPRTCLAHRLAIIGAGVFVFEHRKLVAHNALLAWLGQFLDVLLGPAAGSR